MPTIDTDTLTCAPAADNTGAGASPCARFGRVPARWLEDPGVGVEELAVLTALAVHADRDGVCVVRQRTLAGLLRRSREWVCRVLARLCEPGRFVEKERRADRDGWNLACRYRLPDLAAPEDSRADIPGEPRSGTSASGTGGTTLDGVGDPAGSGDPAPAEPAMPPSVEPMAPAPVEPATPEAVTPAPAESVASAPAAVITPAPAGVTGGAHQEQTPLNKDSSSGATLRCAGCHCRERAPDGSGTTAGAADQSCPVPADWRPDAGDLAWLAVHRPDLDAGHMTAVFVCGARARGLRYADPSAAWRRWALGAGRARARPAADRLGRAAPGLPRCADAVDEERPSCRPGGAQRRDRPRGAGQHDGAPRRLGGGLRRWAT